ncbi:hypothetical protein NLI96_g13223 [Meripilus lineatus]|uniref:Uncharacterized protein n=1 Tax=Meripilus lineatus TaxID=2056292 RepID=A0AAD5UNF6_9APHY|nr:hypothetical protein NLI96_g13223 [Physisporinus lineatus]
MLTELISTLFTIASTANSKIPITAINVINAVALILHDQAPTLQTRANQPPLQDITEEIATEAINAIKPVIDDFKTQTSDLLDKISSMKTFVQSVSADLAAFTLAAKEAATSSSAPQRTWAQITSETPPPANNAINHLSATNPTAARVLQLVRLNARRTSMTYKHDPTNQLDTSPEALERYKKTIESFILSKIRDTNPSPPHPIPKRPVLALTSKRQGLIHIEFASPAINNWFLNHGSLALTSIHSSAAILPPSYHIICRFVPCNGSFDPDDRSDLDDIETSHGLQKGSIRAAKWIKPPENRKPDQKVANLKIEDAQSQQPRIRRNPPDAAAVSTTAISRHHATTKPDAHTAQKPRTQELTVSTKIDRVA